MQARHRVDKAGRADLEAREADGRERGLGRGGPGRVIESGRQGGSANEARRREGNARQIAFQSADASERLKRKAASLETVALMSHAVDTAGRFDRTADIYDETREALSEEAIDKASLVLSKDGCRRILEVGIGTGRIAKPLLGRNFELVGVDFSRGMLAKAKEKGIEDLVMGEANHLPFEDKVFDAALMAHVLHLLDSPAETFGKLARVARNEVVILVRKREGASISPGGDELLGLRQTFARAAEEMGYSLPSRSRDWLERFKREREFLSAYPPDELITIQDATVVTTLGERLASFEKRAYGYPEGIPEDVFQKVMERVRSSMDASKEIRYRREEQMAIWRLAH
jgi:SAM-dependent methyltransferase